MTTNALIGLALGALVGFIGFVQIRRLADRIQAARPGDEGARTAGLLRTVAIMDLVLFTAGGAVVGHLFFPSG